MQSHLTNHIKILCNNKNSKTMVFLQKGASSVADDQGSCVEHISPQNLLHPGYQGIQRSRLSYHSEGTNSNSSLSMVDEDMM